MAATYHQRVEATARWLVQGSTHVLELTGRNLDRSKPAVIWCHGWPDASTWQDNLSANLNWGSSSLLATGHAVLLPFTGPNWGHASATFPSGGGGTGRQAIDDAQVAAVSAGHPDRVHLVGLSMGGCNALNWAWRNPTLVAGVQLFVPVVDLPSMWDQLTYRASLNGVYGTADRASFVTASGPTDPVRNLTPVAALAGRVAAYGARDDTVINWATLSAFCEAAGIGLAASGPVGTDGGGHLFWALTDAYNEYDMLRHLTRWE